MEPIRTQALVFALVASLICICIAIAGCGKPPSPVPVDDAGDALAATAPLSPAQQKLESMTLEQKVAQLFIIRPEQIVDVKTVTAAGEATQKALQENPVGGICYFGKNLEDPDQTREMLANVQRYSMESSGIPLFLCVDEEGGAVARVSGNRHFGIINPGDMSELGATGNVAGARETGERMGAYLADLGFNVDFAPVADVWSNPANTVVATRSFGSDPQLVAQMALALGQGLESKGVTAVYKHFPGHGSTVQDSHDGYALVDKSLAELQECDLVPFQAAIDDGAGWIMVGHLSVPQITGDDTPASLSYAVCTKLLREQMGFKGIIVTDGLDMGAIVNMYGSGEAAVLALEAGVDVLLLPADYYEAYEAVLEAVRSGRISEQRLDESILRILEAKM
ncbi:MAG: glycoside hydrolase family 3 protein [Coriobacteriales bacterium]|nr:glycoside hydrolase family 3 protein [Coriobacteriales bacterium]